MASTKLSGSATGDIDMTGYDLKGVPLPDPPETATQSLSLM